MLSALFTINPSWIVIVCRGDVHWGFLSLIKILLDCCSHVTQILWAKCQQSPFRYTHVHVHTYSTCRHPNLQHTITSETHTLAHMQISRLIHCKVSSGFTYVLHESLQVIYIIACRHIQPIYVSPHNSAIGFWLIFFLQHIHCTHGALRTPDKEPIVYFITTRRIQPCTSAETHDWLALSLCDYLLFIQSGRCTGTKSSACYSHLSLPHPLQTSHMLLPLICTGQ